MKPFVVIKMSEYSGIEPNEVRYTYKSTRIKEQRKKNILNKAHQVRHIFICPNIIAVDPIIPQKRVKNNPYI